MTDTNETPPIQVAASPAMDQAAATVRILLLVLGVGTTIAGFVSKRDLAGFIAYVQSSDFITALAVLITVGTFSWSQWKTRHRAKQLAAIAADPRVPEEVVTLKGSVTKPGESAADLADRLKAGR
jgi:hypothetical protein